MSDAKHDALGPAAFLSEVLHDLAKTIDARAGADPASSWTAKLLAGGPELAAKKFGEESVELVIAVSTQGDEQVAAEAADVVYHLMVALRSRGVSLDAVGKVLDKRRGVSGIEEKASRG